MKYTIEQPEIIDRIEEYDEVMLSIPGFHEYITIDEENMDNEHTWLHEAVECSLYKLDLDKVITIGDEIGMITTVAHIMTSWSIGYSIDYDIESGEYKVFTADEFDRLMRRIDKTPRPAGDGNTPASKKCDDA